ncbi:unnamed protein product [Calypogeia fissa]|jgi:formylmethanofuran dehydrogenase subunit E
MVEKR